MLFCKSLRTASVSVAVSGTWGSLATVTTDLLRVCVVGSGPAGFYVTDKLLRSCGEYVRVDLIDRLPSPYGLARSGVAPDHQDTKNVINGFKEELKDPRVSFLGNVNVGKDVSLGELRSLYHAVVLAYGAEGDKRLNIPGEDLPGVYSAREFVWWYNGHPDTASMPVDLSRVTSAAVLGVGNVALDCARVLLRPAADLMVTDIASHAMQQLRSSGTVCDVHLLARRGPLQAACTPKELKELVNLAGLRAVAEPSQLALSTAEQQVMKAVRLKRRVFELISSAVSASGTPSALERRLHFQFYRAPVEVLPDAEGRARAVRAEVTRLEPVEGGDVVAKGTGQFVEVEAQLVLKSIGYRSLPIPGLPFDHRSGTVPNTCGRVLQAADAASPPGPSAAPGVEPALYVCGWLKRGPTGIIGTNLVDAEETVAAMVEDSPAWAHPAGRAGLCGTDGLRALLASRSVRVVPYAGWERIDEAELAAGQHQGRLREKIVDVQDMLEVAGA